MRHLSTEQYPKIYLYKRVVQAKLFMDAHFSKPIAMDAISGEACFSKYHFIRLFTKLYGKTPHQYLIAVRINQAMLLLRAGQPVSEVCSAVGFESLSSFSSLFRRRTGLSPARYLKQQQEKKIQIHKTPLAFVPGCFAHQFGWNKNSNFEER